VWKLPRSKWRAAAIGAVVIAALIAVTLYFGRGRSSTSAEDETAAEVSAKAEAPPDLQKLREKYTNGVEALKNDKAADAVQQLSSFTFGPRAVEEYRLWYLANAYDKSGNTGAARATLAKLWHRSPKLVHAHDAGSRLAQLYADNGNAAQSADLFAGVAARATDPAIIASARWRAALQRLQSGDPASALYDARQILIHAPRADEAKKAIALVRALTGTPENSPFPLTPSERIERAIALMNANDAQTALEELTELEGVAPPGLANEVKLQRGIALHRLRRFEESNKVIEPLTSGAFKTAIPALRTAARNYAIVAASINPKITKTLKEKKKVGTVKQKVGKGKKRRTVTKPKYAIVFRKVELIDLAKKTKKDEYDRLASERLKDLLQLRLDTNVRIDVLTSLIDRAASKNQDAYVMQLVPELIKLSPLEDPALQHFWDKAWAAYARGDLATANKLFRYISDTYPHVNVRRQSEYWFARTIERQGQKPQAQAIYQRLAQAPYADLYAMHSIQRGAKRTENKTNPLKREGPDWRELAEKQMPHELQLAYELTALASMADAFEEIRRNARRENVRFAEALLAEYYHAKGDRVSMYRSLRRAWPQLATVEQDSTPTYFLKMYYPVKYGDEIEEHAKERGVDPNLVRALILQESYYNPKAKSRVGATGLMQLMPPTAKEHASKLRVPFAASRLETPDVNINLGTFHLKMLIDMFRGNTYFAVASYNAGQGNVLKWRRAAPSKPVDEFLESIPFPETRNYVKRVTMLRSAYSRLTL
jgi:soluble lytic murein transglycosylase-like protein